jgi:hypothetical protein
MGQKIVGVEDRRIKEILARPAQVISHSRRSSSAFRWLFSPDTFLDPKLSNRHQCPIDSCLASAW